MWTFGRAQHFCHDTLIIDNHFGLQPNRYLAQLPTVLRGSQVGQQLYHKFPSTSAVRLQMTQFVVHCPCLIVLHIHVSLNYSPKDLNGQKWSLRCFFFVICCIFLLRHHSPFHCLICPMLLYSFLPHCQTHFSQGHLSEQNWPRSTVLGNSKLSEWLNTQPLFSLKNRVPCDCRKVWEWETFNGALVPISKCSSV